MAATPHSPEDITRLLKEQRQSGMSVTAFARSHGINLSTFHGWRYREAQAQKDAARSKKALVPVVVAKASPHVLPSSPTSSASVRLALPGGAVLEWPHGVSARFVRELAEALA